jgi:hypothetical protein
VPQVVRPHPDGPRGNDDCGRLRGQPEAPREGAAERLEGRPLGALAPGDGRARGALPQVGPELRALGPGDRLVQLLRDEELGLGTRDGALELLAQRAPRAENERLDRAPGEPEHLGDLRVRAPFDLAQDDGRPLVEREVSERPADVLRRRPVVVGGGDLVGDVVVELDLLWPARRRPEALEAHVVGDLDQPVQGSARVLPALERLVRVEERRLRDVLRVGRVAEHAARVAVHVRRVPLVEALE